MSTLDVIVCDHEPKHALGLCKRCYRRYHARGWRARNPERNKATQRAAYHRNRAKANTMTRNSVLKRQYGITLEDYYNILQRQSGKCAMRSCSRRPIKHEFPVDHDHNTGLIRGILCHRHNLGLGQFGDSLDELLDAVYYLEEGQRYFNS